jgi:hypothetical protein
MLQLQYQCGSPLSGIRWHPVAKGLGYVSPASSHTTQSVSRAISRCRTPRDGIFLYVVSFSSRVWSRNNPATVPVSCHRGEEWFARMSTSYRTKKCLEFSNVPQRLHCDMPRDHGIMGTRAGSNDEFGERICTIPRSWRAEQVAEAELHACSKNEGAEMCRLTSHGQLQSRHWYTPLTRAGFQCTCLGSE